jgi:hypothetical protein
MAEHIAHLGPMLILAGLMAGWMAQAASRADGHGLVLDMALGLIASVVVGSTVWVALAGAGMLGMLLIGGGGAAFAIAAQRTRWPSARLGT